MKTTLRAMLSLAAIAAAFALPAPAEEGAKGDLYTLDVCPVSGEKLGSMGDPIVMSVDGREVRFCCDGCPKKYKAGPSKYVPKIDKMMTDAQASLYPTDTCVVSGKPLDAKAVSMVVGNRLMKFCCADCPKKAAADPATYIAKLDEAAIAKQSEKYPLKTCAVSGDKLGEHGDVIKLVVGGRLIELCCADCKKEIAKDPAKVLSKVSAGK